VLPQVALSQFIAVKAGAPRSLAWQNRFYRLVADFVLCRRDFGIIAVIEVDDPSHARAERQRADARKPQVVESAGLRLVRIPAGQLPSDARLRAMITETGFEAEYTVAPTPPPVSAMDSTPAAILRPFAKMAAIAAVIGCGWAIYSQVPQAAPAARVPATEALPSAPDSRNSALAKQAETKRRDAAAVLAAQDLADAYARRKAAAWAAYYAAPVSCDHPPAWKDQIDCANQYMRAKREFERRWSDEPHLGGGVPLGQDWNYREVLMASRHFSRRRDGGKRRGDREIWPKKSDATATDLRTPRTNPAKPPSLADTMASVTGAADAKRRPPG
jgi:hypothetical protein